MAEFGQPVGPLSSQKGTLEFTASNKLKAPKNVVLSHETIRSDYKRLRQNAIKRVQFYLAVDGLIAGRPPFDQAELDAAGLDWLANINTMDADGIYNKSCQAYWLLSNLSQTHAKIVYKSNQQEDSRISEILSRNFQKVLKSWPSYSKLNALNVAQIVKYGISAIVWPNQKSWKWRVVDTARFYIPDQSQTDMDQMTMAMMDTDMTAQYLFSVYETFKDKDPENHPWKTDNIAELLLTLSKADNKGQKAYADIDNLVKGYYNGDTELANTFSDSVPLICRLQVEYEETLPSISQYLVHPTIGKNIYEAKKAYRNFNEVLQIYTYSPGEATIHATRGLGDKIFTMSQGIMRVDNSILNTTQIAATPILSGPATSFQDAQGIKFYPGVPTFVGAGEFQQNNFGSNINQLVGASQYFTNKQNVNLGNAGDDPQQIDKANTSMSSEQFKSKKVDDFAILRVNIAHFYESEDYKYQNIVAKMLRSKPTDLDHKEAKRWKKLCLSEGVPPEIFEMPKQTDEDDLLLPDPWEVTATRATGNGSSVATLFGLEQVAAMIPNLPARGVNEFNRMVVNNTIGPDHVSSLLGDSTPDEVAGGASLAGQENNSMESGKSPIFSPDNVHRSHFVIHMALATNTIQKLQQQEIDPVQADLIFNSLVPHLEEHFKALQAGIFTKLFAEQQQANFMQVQNFATQNASNAARVKQAALKEKIANEEGTQETMNEEQRKDFALQKDIERKTQEVMSKEERTAAAEERRGEIMADKVVLDHKNKTLDILLKNKREVEDASLERLREDIKDRNGDTPAPNDIESKPKKPTGK